LRCSSQSCRECRRYAAAAVRFKYTDRSDFSHAIVRGCVKTRTHHPRRAGTGRPAKDRAALAIAFMAKAIAN
jgi:hypothetical protein